MFLIEYNVMPNLKTKEPWFYDIISLFKESGQTI